jgi:hypothetical protein
MDEAIGTGYYINRWLDYEYDPDRSEEYNTLLSLMYVDYLYCEIYNDKIKHIQACWRRYRDRKCTFEKIHRIHFVPVIRDLVDVGYSPPNKRYPLLWSGGYRYREGLESFMKLQFK